MEIYVDDMVIKSKTFCDFLDDVKETFETLRKVSMKLNPKKCVFGVGAGKFLGYMISENDIRANPKKVQAIIDMASPQTVKGIQSLNGRLAAFNRFLSRLADRAQPFFKTLKGGISKGGMESVSRESFPGAKTTSSGTPSTYHACPGGYVYLAAAEDAMSAVLLREDKGIQRPVYFVSKLLQGAEKRYPDIEKLVLALIHAARRLKHYFQAHPKHVLTDQPLKQVLLKPEASGTSYLLPR